jgi:hypothetical protein
MFKPTRRRTQTASTTSIPAMTGGWNARDPLPLMKPDDAVALDNFFPGTGGVDMRRGSVNYATGVGTGTVQTLMEYASGATRHLIAAASGSLYNITGGGPAGAALASGFASDLWQSVNFGGSLILCNGSDTPQLYNGTVAASTVSGTGLAASDLVHVMAHKSRLYFIEKNTLSFWYLATLAIQGVAVEFDLSRVFRLGGSLQALGTWTRDGGAGADDMAVFITDRGEAAIYQGSDPSDADNWSLVGVFRIGTPVGRRCVIKFGADLAVVTTDGVQPFSQVLPVDRASGAALSITDKVRSAFSYAARTYGTLSGWQIFDYPRGNWLAVNVPTTSSTETHHQYVMNALTGAWCRFKGMNAACWGLYGDDLYFGGALGVVYKADIGYSDDGATITGDAWGSNQYFGSRGQLKQFRLIRPILTSLGSPTLAIAILTDYDDTAPSGAVTLSGQSPLWDTVFWDESYWGSESSIIKDWIGVSALGTAAAVRLRITTGASLADESDLEYLAQEDGTALLAEDGGLIVLEEDGSVANASGGRVYVNEVPLGIYAFDVVFERGGIV